MLASEKSKSKTISGEDHVKIDPRNRINLSKFRAKLGDTFVLALTEWNSVCAYPVEAWDKRFVELDEYPANNMARAKCMRLLFESCDEEATFDSQGRVTISPKLKSIGKLDSEVTIIGAGDRLEIWNPDEYKKFQEDEDGYGIERREKLKRAYGELTSKA